MKTKFIIIVTLKALLIGACTGNNANTEGKFAALQTSNSEKSHTIINAENFAGKLDELLTLEMAARVSGFEAEMAQKKYDNKASVAFGGSKKPPRECNYYWENVRKRAITVGENTMKAPYKDLVGINWVSNTTLERFKRNYSALSEQQKIAANKQLDEESEKKQNNDPNEANKHVADLGKDLISNLRAEEISGVGEAAVWYENTNELKVFYQGLTFTLVVDVSDNKNLNKVKTIALAHMIINEKLKNYKN